MQELKVIGVEDGALVAASEDGARFRIEIDEVLQSRIRHAVPETNTGPRLSPREVQAHIRSGLSAEEVAELTGASVDAIRRFEGPVLAEREHMVTSALAVPMHAPGDADGEEPASFGSMVRERLAGLGANGERWASWKDDEHGWMVKLEFTADGIDHDARWTFEPRKHALHPQNADAATLSKQGEVRGGMIPRLRAVSPDDESSRFDSGAFTFEPSDTAEDDTAPQPEVAAPRQPAPTSSAAASRAAIKRADEPAPPTGETADLLEALRRRRGERESVTGASERMSQPAPFAPVPPPAAHADTSVAPAPLAPESMSTEADGEQADESPAGSAARALWGGKASSASRPKKGRAAMPSWDEIVFGARTDDDLA
ncbi:septation protein SepH [Agromyces sp. ZXT2-6]|uniref:septation protein SepH n=1 Tax=Agromyces sp. ZXT2-6 TaxID=3461153 RepID=UPI00405511BD